MSDAVTRHAPALPLAVMAPGPVAAVGLSIPLLVPFVVLALAFGVVSAPFVALWWLVGAIRRQPR